MDTDNKIICKHAVDLTDNEAAQIKDAIFREFKQPFEKNDQLEDKLFFLLKENDQILSMGAIHEVKPVIFNGEEYSFYGILNIISNIKGKGYGKRVVSAIREYLVDHDYTGLGFCAVSNRGFYEKCGFVANADSTQRFVYQNSGKNITNQDGQIIFYQESSDRFMEKVLAAPPENVLIPTANLW